MFKFGASYEWTQLEQYSKDTISIVTIEKKYLDVS